MKLFLFYVNALVTARIAHQTPPGSGPCGGRSIACGRCRISRKGLSRSAGGREHRSPLCLPKNKQNA